MTMKPTRMTKPDVLPALRTTALTGEVGLVRSVASRNPLVAFRGAL